MKPLFYDMSGFVTDYTVDLYCRNEMLNDDFDIDEFKKDIKETFEQKALDILKPLEQFGIKAIETNFYSPKYYNYTGDCYDVKFEFDDNIFKKDGLKDEISLYLSTIKKKSFDGYCSLEPDTFDEVKQDDFAYIYGAMLKTNILDKWVDFIGDIAEYIDSNYCFEE